MLITVLSTLECLAHLSHAAQMKGLAGVFGQRETPLNMPLPDSDLSITIIYRTPLLAVVNSPWSPTFIPSDCKPGLKAFTAVIAYPGANSMQYGLFAAGIPANMTLPTAYNYTERMYIGHVRAAVCAVVVVDT